MDGLKDAEMPPGSAEPWPGPALLNSDGVPLVELGEAEDMDEEVYETDGSDDEGDDDPQYHFPSPSFAAIPRTDSFANRFVTVVHTTGVHHLPLIACACKEEELGRDHFLMDLVYSRFYPASLRVVSTLFTEAVLDDYHLSNLECKVSAYQYFQRLRRMTDNLSLAGVRSRYHEFRRTTRLYRWMQHLLLAGYMNDGRSVDDPKPGEFITECPACPNPEVNLPPDWTLDPDQ